MPFIAAAIAVIGSAISATAVAVASTAAELAISAGLSAGIAAGIGNALLFAVPSAIEFGALAGASALLTPKPKVNSSGSPQSFKADPLAPSPFVMARYGVGGNLVYETTSGGGSKASAGAAGNEYLTHFVILGGLGPYPAIEKTQLDDTVLTFSGQQCSGGYIDSEYVQTYNPGYSQNPNGSYANNNYSSHVWQALQLGAPAQGGMPYPDKLTSDNAGLPEWTAQHGFDTFAAASILRSYNTTVWAGGVGQPMWTFSGGYPVYDPTKDSTYPGGAGSQRWAGAGATAAQLWAARATWAPSNNPNLHALNFALGFYLPDKDGVVRLYAGCGAGLTGVNIDAFVRAASVATANGWKITGQWTSQDGKRSVLTAMLQAGGAQLISDRGRISCTVSTPRTALNANAPLTWADLAGAPSLDTGTSVRERFNTAYVRYTSETHRWQVVQADTPVKAAAYIAEDGGWVRSKTVEFEYVPAVNQACQLGAYAIVDGREIPNIVLPGKPHLQGYDVGDCLMVDLPELGLHLAKLVVLKRSHDPSTSTVTLTCRTETDAKHAYALGISGVAPPTPSISGFDPSIVAAPIPGSWAAAAASYTDAVSGEIVHVIRINGSTVDNVYAAQVVVSYRQVFTDAQGGQTYGPWQDQTYPASLELIDLDLPAGVWQVELHYITVHGSEDVDNTLDLGTITVEANTAANTANVGAMTAAEVNAQVSQLLSDVNSLQSGDNPTLDAAVAAAQAAEQGALTAEGQANTALGQVESYANEVTTQTGVATQAADNSASSAETAIQAAGSASGSAGVAAASELQVQVSGAQTFPSGMSVPGFWGPSGSANPQTPYAIGDPRFYVAIDATPVFANRPNEFDVCATVGVFTPVAGRTYSSTSTYRLKTAPTDGVDSLVQQAFFVQYTDETYDFFGYAGADSAAGLIAGQAYRLVSEFTYDGVKPAAWARPYAVLNGALAPPPYSDGVYELISLMFEDVTESTSAAGSAQASLSSEQNAAASESATAGYAATAGAAETAAVQAQNDAGSSASAASGSDYSASVHASDAAVSATSAQGFAGQAATFAGQAEAQAGYAEGFAATASDNASAAYEYANLVANYNPGANLVLNPSGGQGLSGWNQSSGTSIYASPSDPNGPCFLYINGSGAVQTVNDYIYQAQTYPVNTGKYSIQVECINYGAQSGQIIAGIIWHIPGQGDQYSYVSPPLNLGGTWTRYTLPNVSPPAGATSATWYLQSYGITYNPGGLVGFRKFKIETGSVCTPFTDDQLSATVSQTAGAVAGLNGKTVAFLKQVVAASGSTPAEVFATSGDGTSLVEMVAAVLSLSTLTGDFKQVVLRLIGNAAYFAGPVYISNNIRIDPAVPGIVFDNGAAACVLGLDFGASNDLVFWLGKSMAPTAMTKNNAILFFGADASATFRGAFNSGAGSKTTSVSDPTVNPTANISTTNFPYTGHGMTVVLGFSYSAGQSVTTSGPSRNGTNAVVVTLYRSINGGSEAAIGSYTFQGDWDHTGGTPAEPGDDTSQCGGSVQVIDTSNVAAGQSLVYRAAISSYGIHSSGSPMQSLSLVIDEPAS